MRELPEAFPTFTSTQTDPEARGREFGLAWRDEIRACRDKYLALFAGHGVAFEQARFWGEQAADQLSAWAPELAAEVTGLADGADLPLWQAGVLSARTEILAAARSTGLSECSTAVTLPRDGEAPRTIQTWDWHESLRYAAVGWRYQPRPGFTVSTFTEFGLLAKIGVNSAGIGLHFNMLRHNTDHDRIGVPVHAVARRILDRASTVDEATQIAQSASVSASTVLTVVGFSRGTAAVRGLELSPAGVGIVPDEDGFYLHTNHFLDPELSAGEWTGAMRLTTYERLKQVRGHRQRLGSADLADRVAAMHSHSEDGAPVCAHPVPGDPPHLRSETLATVSLDVAQCRLHVHRGGPCKVTPHTWQIV